MIFKASICTIGDEILIGQIVDTNSSHIAQALNSIGVRVTSMLSIADDASAIKSKLKSELFDNEIVIVTGGLGPTKDDITKSSLAELAGCTSVKVDERQLSIIRKLLSARGLDLLEANIRQAEVPTCCDVIPNKLGTAPIMVFRFNSGEFGHNTTLYSLPGVPFEALNALEDVLADIKEHCKLPRIVHKTIMTYGLAESALAKKIEAWESSLPSDIHLAYLPNPLSGVRLRLSIYDTDVDKIAVLERQIAGLQEIIGDYIYSYEDDTLPSVIGKMLKSSGKTVCCAESCTGGMISSLFTSVPGASEYYLGSVTSYDNAIKQKVLEVPSDILLNYGAVSSECVAKMAEGVRQLMNADYSVATSGIAGPGGGSKEKPVGIVWIGVSSDRGTETYKLQFNSDRKRNIERFTSSALEILRKKIKNELNV